MERYFVNDSYGLGIRVEDRTKRRVLHYSGPRTRPFAVVCRCDTREMAQHIADALNQKVET